jgi:hypothetical protein
LYTKNKKNINFLLFLKKMSEKREASPTHELPDAKKKQSVFISSSEIEGLLIPKHTLSSVKLPTNSQLDAAAISSSSGQTFPAVIKEMDWFKLEYEVEEHQRKSRYIQPSPIIVLLKEPDKHKDIINGTVVIKLIFEDGGQCTPEQALYLKGDTGEIIQRNLGRKGSASFGLRMMGVVDKKVMLQFEISATLGNGEKVKQLICSAPFSVHDGKHIIWVTPTLKYLNPSEAQVTLHVVR